MYCPGEIGKTDELGAGRALAQSFLHLTNPVQTLNGFVLLCFAFCLFGLVFYLCPPNTVLALSSF